MPDIDIHRIPDGAYALRIDPEFGVIQPWYTHGALDEIQAWDVRDKVVLEWGGGCSTFWWAKKAKHVYTIEAHKEWAEWIEQTKAKHGMENISVFERWPDPAAEYLSVPDGCKPDIVCIDGSSRTECLHVALSLPRPITVVFDNWMQDGIYFDVDAEALMKQFDGHFHVQADHTDHVGHPWQTAIWHLT